MFTPWPIGFVSTPYKETSDVPKGLGARHDAEGIITLLPDFEAVSPTSKASRTSTSSGNSIAAGISS